MEDDDSIRNALDRAESSVGRAVASALDYVQEQNSEAQIQHRIEAGQIDEVVQDMDRAGEQIAHAVNDIYDQAMRDVAQAVSRSIDRKFHADPQNPLAVSAMRDNTLRIRGELTEEQRLVVREILTEAVQIGQNPLETAREVKQAIGLTRYQLNAVDNYRDALERNSLDALNRQLRDRRFDRSVQRAWDADAPLSREQIARMVDRYRARWLTYRAETIARTESLRAVHQGADEAFRQAIERGDLRADQLLSTWHHHDPQKNPRSFHQEMDGQQKPWGIPFVSGQGNELRFPCDPDAPVEEVVNCHCARSVRIRPGLATAANDNLDAPGLPTPDSLVDGRVYTVNAAAVAGRVYGPVSGFQEGRVETQRRLAAQGNSPGPVKAVMDRDGNLEITDGRHRFLAALRDGRDVEIRIDEAARGLDIASQAERGLLALVDSLAAKAAMRLEAVMP